MHLYKNGYVVAEMNAKENTYNSWPLHELYDDEMAQALTDQAYDTWFNVYDMQEIVPDLHYIKAYLNYCNSINLRVKVLLFESLNSNLHVDDEIEICEVLGFDCIGNVYYSYLLTEFNACKSELLDKNITANKYGLLDRLDDVLFFIELRKEVIASGVNLEDFWDETPVRISIVNPL